MVDFGLSKTAHRGSYPPEADVGSNPAPATKENPVALSAGLLFFLMFYVYILYSESFGRSYTGFTSDLEQRLLSHNELSKKDWTKRYRPWVLIYSEVYSTKGEAMAREKFLKTGKGRELVRAKVEAYKNKSS